MGRRRLPNAPRLPNARPPGPLDNPTTRLAMQRLVDYFDFYWRGEVNEWKRQDDAGDRETAYKTMVVPRLRQSPRDQNAQPLGAPPLDPIMARGRYGNISSNTRKDQWKKEVNEGEGGIINFTKPLGLRLRRVLGKGGQGIACLFRLTSPDGSTNSLVVKAAIKDPDNIAREVQNLAVRGRYPARCFCTPMYGYAVTDTKFARWAALDGSRAHSSKAIHAERGFCSSSTSPTSSSRCCSGTSGR